MSQISGCLFGNSTTLLNEADIEYSAEVWPGHEFLEPEIKVYGLSLELGTSLASICLSWLISASLYKK